MSAFVAFIVFNFFMSDHNKVVNGIQFFPRLRSNSAKAACVCYFHIAFLPFLRPIIIFTTVYLGQEVVIRRQLFLRLRLNLLLTFVTFAQLFNLFYVQTSFSSKKVDIRRNFSKTGIKYVKGAFFCLLKCLETFFTPDYQISSSIFLGQKIVNGIYFSETGVELAKVCLLIHAFSVFIPSF